MKVKRDKYIPVRVNEAELEKIKEKADKVGVPVSTFLRIKAIAD